MKFEVIAMSQTTLDYKDDSLMLSYVMPYGMRDKMSHNYLPCSWQDIWGHASLFIKKRCKAKLIRYKGWKGKKDVILLFYNKKDA